VHGGHSVESRVLLVQVQTLGLADEGSARGSHIDHDFLGDFPNDLVKILDPFRDLRNSLDGSVRGDNHVFNLTGPKSVLSQVLNEVLVHTDEFSRKDTSGVDVRSEGLERLVVSEDLRGRSSGHGGN
jgi:hypothetical protein